VGQKFVQVKPYCIRAQIFEIDDVSFVEQGTQ
jgi:hypothetical protein